MNNLRLPLVAQGETSSNAEEEISSVTSSGKINFLIKSSKPSRLPVLKFVSNTTVK